MIDFITGLVFIVVCGLVVYGIFRQTADEQIQWRERKREEMSNDD